MESFFYFSSQPSYYNYSTQLAILIFNITSSVFRYIAMLIFSYVNGYFLVFFTSPFLPNFCKLKHPRIQSLGISFPSILLVLWSPLTSFEYYMCTGSIHTGIINSNLFSDLQAFIFNYLLQISCSVFNEYVILNIAHSEILITTLISNLLVSQTP